MDAAEKEGGYLHSSYASSLSAYGTPYKLNRSGGWILERRIARSSFTDAMGLYPLFCCRDWAALDTDIELLGTRLVSISLVTDPFGAYTLEGLKRSFKDKAIVFKQHFVIDLSRPPEDFVSKHHRRYARKKIKGLKIELCDNPPRLWNEWVGLYSNLVKRHNVKGLLKFSRTSFSRQLSVPGIVAFRAIYQEKTVGMLLWYMQSGKAYYHLGAYSDLGYKAKASFPLFWCALEHFKKIGLRWLDLGAGAGVAGNGEDGLTAFKRGWSTGTRPAYFCGRIFDRAIYDHLMKTAGAAHTNYFPAYRAGEFT